MNFLRNILSNGFIPVIPILIWNLLFTSKLPPALGSESFNRAVPLLILLGENILRSIFFLFILFIKLEIKTVNGRIGFRIYSIGVILYFLSWLLLMYFPNSFWSNNIPGFSAPAVTPFLWMLGISLMAESFYFKLPFIKWYLIIPSLLFILFHTAHTVIVYQRTY